MQNRQENTCCRSHVKWQRIVRRMEAFQDLIVIFLCLSLFGIMVIQLFGMFQALLQPLAFQEFTSQILSLLILVELFRLLMIYLQEHCISVGVAVEVTVVSVLREVIVHGALETSWTQLLAICGFLLTLGALLLVSTKVPHTKQEAMWEHFGEQQLQAFNGNHNVKKL